jgi:hypothetical protein
MTWAPGHGAELIRPDDAGEAHEIVDGVFIRPAGAAVAKAGEPLDLGRDLRKALELGGGQEPLGPQSLS